MWFRGVCLETTHKFLGETSGNIFPPGLVVRLVPFILSEKTWRGKKRQLGLVINYVRGERKNDMDRLSWCRTTELWVSWPTVIDHQPWRRWKMKMDSRSSCLTGLGIKQDTEWRVRAHSWGSFKNNLSKADSQWWEWFLKGLAFYWFFEEIVLKSSTLEYIEAHWCFTTRGRA